MSDAPPWDRVVDGLRDINASVKEMQTAVVIKLDMMAKYSAGEMGAAAGNAMHGDVLAGVIHPQTPVSTPGAGGGGYGGGGAGGSNRGPLPSGSGGPPLGGTASSPGGLGGVRSRIGGVAGRGGGGVTDWMRGPNGAVALGIAREGFKGITSINEEVARYQGFSGGTRRQALDEKTGETLFAMTHNQATNLNGFFGKEAAQAYADVSAMGFNDRNDRQLAPSRGEVLDFMNRNKINMGMDLNENVNVMNEAIRSPTTRLSELSKALHQVSDAASKAGANARQVRANFLTLFHGLVDSGAGPGAARLAGRQASALAALGPGFQDIDVSTQFSPAMQYRAAQNAGMTPGAYQTMLRKNPEKALATIEGMAKRDIANIIGPTDVAWIKQHAADYGGRDAVAKDPSLINQLGQDWANASSRDMNMVAAAIKSATGITLDPGDVPVWVVSRILDITASGLPGAGGQGGTIITNARGEQVYLDSGAPVAGADKAALAKAGSGNTGQESTRAGGKALNDAQRAYREVVGKSGKPGYREAGIEKLLSSTKDHDKIKVIVTTKGGPREMTLAEAIAHYKDSVASGNIQFLEGKDAEGKDLMGQGFQDVTGLMGDSRELRAERMKDPTVGRAIDLNDPKYKKLLEAGKKDLEQEGTNKVIVEVAEGAKWIKRLLTFNDLPGEVSKMGIDDLLSGGFRLGKGILGLGRF